MEFSFEKLTMWQKSRELVKDIYKLTVIFPERERFGLTDQIRRAAVSVPSNLAEGSGRISAREKIHFCEIAYGSLMEVMCQLMLAQDLNFILPEQMDEIRPKIESLSRLISAYRRSMIQPQGLWFIVYSLRVRRYPSAHTRKPFSKP